jgi:6-phosphofructokinase 1
VVPEIPWSVHKVADRVNRLWESGNTRATVIVAEGVFKSQGMEPFDAYGYLCSHDPGYEITHSPNERMTAHTLAAILRYMCEGCEARATTLGYIQRGRAPSAYDAWFAFEAGHLAVKLLRDGITEQVIGIRNGRVFNMPIAEALSKKPHFKRSLLELVNSL